MNLQRVDYEPRKAVKMIKSDPKKKYRRLFKKPTKVIKIFISIIMNPVAIYYVIFPKFQLFCFLLAIIFYGFLWSQSIILR